MVTVLSLPSKAKKDVKDRGKIYENAFIASTLKYKILKPKFVYPDPPPPPHPCPSQVFIFCYTSTVVCLFLFHVNAGITTLACRIVYHGLPQSTVFIRVLLWLL
jgi:hypothetical protein